jgi:hypothetical protein
MSMLDRIIRQPRENLFLFRRQFIGISVGIAPAGSGIIPDEG